MLVTVLSALMVLVSVGSGFGKLKKVPQVMQSMEAVGVKPNQVPILAALEIAGGAGLVIGVWIQPLGQLAAVCLAFYFAGAVIGHLRKKHGLAEFGPALVILLIAVASAYLQLQR
ncbi:MAG: hypothetical protein RLZZ330_348 [Actinomycetota bacterium]|jgi:uncharacterized membrane protein YphA (DoxX/SURF4 family)